MTLEHPVYRQLGHFCYSSKEWQFRKEMEGNFGRHFTQ